jgi:hypothetical protein
MKEKLDALHKNHTWDLVDCPQGSLLLGVSGSTKLRLVLMVLLTNARLDLWLEVLLRSMVWIMRRPLLLLLAYLLCVLYWQLQPLDIGHFLKWT